MTVTEHRTARTTLSPNALAMLASLKDVQAKMAGLAEIEAALKTAIQAEIGDAPEAVDESGSVVARWSYVRKFDASTAISMLTEEQIKACNKEVFEPAAAKKLLTGEQLEQCMRPSGERRFSMVA